MILLSCSEQTVQGNFFYFKNLCCRGGVRVPGGHLCVAEAPIEAAAETYVPSRKVSFQISGGDGTPSPTKRIEILL